MLRIKISAAKGVKMVLKMVIDNRNSSYACKVAAADPTEKQKTLYQHREDPL